MFQTLRQRGLVVGSHQGAELLSDDGPHLFHTRQSRHLAVLVLLVIDLIPVHVDLQNAGHAWGDLYSDILAALGKKLVGLPGRSAEILSRHAVDDLYVELSFTSHVYLLARLSSGPSVALMYSDFPAHT